MNAKELEKNREKMRASGAGIPQFKGFGEDSCLTREQYYRLNGMEIPVRK